MTQIEEYFEREAEAYTEKFENPNGWGADISKKAFLAGAQTAKRVHEMNVKVKALEVMDWFLWPNKNIHEHHRLNPVYPKVIREFYEECKEAEAELAALLGEGT